MKLIVGNAGLNETSLDLFAFPLYMEYRPTKSVTIQEPKYIVSILV